MDRKSPEGKNPGKKVSAPDLEEGEGGRPALHPGGGRHCPGSMKKLALVDLLNPREGVYVSHRLVRPYPLYAWEAERVSAAVPITPLDRVESHFEDYLRLYKAPVSLILQSYLLEPPGHLLDLHIGEPGVSLPDDLET